MNPQSNKQRSLSRGAALWAAGCVAAALWAGAAAAKADTDARRELVLRYLRAVYAQDHAEAYRYISQRDRQAKSEAEYLRENGSLELSLIHI